MKNPIIPTLLLAISLACGGAASVQLDTLPRAPAAVGVVEVKRGANDNTVGKLRVEHMAPPAELGSDLEVYVAWVRPQGSDRWQNIGQLVINKEREATLEVTVPHERFELAITAEDRGDASDPSEFMVMRGEVDARSAS